MPVFSEASLQKLNTCHPDLIRLFTEVIKYYDCTVVYGYRNEQEQNEAYEKGNSKLPFPRSNHNKSPSMAIDVLPYPIDWKNKERIILFAGFVLGIAEMLHMLGAIAHKVRWGGDWNQNHDSKDESFFDGAHFELSPF